jgi:hypothetical protein
VPKGATPAAADEAVSVISIDDVAGGLVQIVFRSPSLGRRRIVMSADSESLSNVTVSVSALARLLSLSEAGK